MTSRDKPLNAAGFDKTKQNMTLERLESLYELIGRMNTVYELQGLLEFVVDRALNLTGGKRGLLLLSDDRKRKIQQVALVRGKESGSERNEQAIKSVSSTIITDVLEAGEPRLVLDLPADQRYEGLTSKTTLKNVRSVLAVPLKIDVQLIGLLYIDHPSRKVFGQGDLEFLSAFASQAALAINRARQHQQEVDKLNMLNQLSRSVVQVLDLDEVLTRIVHEANKMLNVETGSVLLLDETTGELAFATSISDGRRVKIDTRLKKDEGVAGWVMSTGKVACISDVSEDPRWFGEEVELGFVTRSLLCVPLELNGRVLGVLQALNKKIPHGFDSGDIALLSAFAASATIAIENARLFEEARQARQLRALNDMAMALSSTLDLRTVLNIGLKKSLEVLKADAGAISLINDQTQTDSLSVQVSRGLSNDPELAREQTRALRALSTLVLGHRIDKILIVDATHPIRRPEGEALLSSGIKALALAPIKAGSEIRGALAVMTTERHIYSSDQTNLLSGIARIVGLAVQNATYYNQMQAQTMHLTYLNEIGTALTSSLDLVHILKVIIEGANSLLESERTSVFLIDDETNELVLRYSNEGNADIRLPAPWRGIAGWVAENDQTALVNDPLKDERHLQEISHKTGFQARSILCVPLKIEEQVIGVVEVLNKMDGRPFTAKDQAMLIHFTKWAAIAIHNARLFRRLLDEQERRVTAETRAAMAAIILDIAHTMNNIVGAIRVWATNLEAAAQTASPPPLARFVQEVGQIRRNAEEAIELIHKLRGPLDPPNLAPTDVHASLARAIKSCWWPENVHLSQHYDPDLPLVRADAERLEAVFHNLLSNAMQVLAETGGDIELTTRRTSGGGAEITITDNGPGIPTRLKDRIFDPGISGKGGIGLGLWLVETFIGQFDGRIAFTSAEGEGTTFVVTLEPMQGNKGAE